MKFSRQTTLRSDVTVTGVGVHSGKIVNLTLRPAGIDSGFIFVRTGLDGEDREVRATRESVTATSFATVLGDDVGSLVSTTEHVLAALRGMGVDNAVIEVDGPEVPIMDGSAEAFADAIDQAGVVQQAAPRRFIEILKPVQVAFGSSEAEFRPYSGGFRAEVEIDFDNAAIGRQSYVFDLTPENFRRDICRARTFGCITDVATLWNAGYALGASLQNSVVFNDTRVLNAEGLRYADECVRHKVLDVVGDLALAGLPLLGQYRSVRGGHKLNHAALSALMADRSAWRYTEATQPVAQPVRRRRVGLDVGGMVGGMVAPAFGPDVS
ncbi:MAG TPA: UDP-3-O-acyl-N-acetylglucosamine deacetylase [Xanthobacteraceae bacterium]|nr:UDP-3-O-acyl-N-acetylglucosamine deacetylase [Xanthobacteraceae bacterium]